MELHECSRTYADRHIRMQAACLEFGPLAYWLQPLKPLT